MMWAAATSPIRGTIGQPMLATPPPIMTNEMSSRLDEFAIWMPRAVAAAVKAEMAAGTPCRAAVTTSDKIVGWVVAPAEDWARASLYARTIPGPPAMVSIHPVAPHTQRRP